MDSELTFGQWLKRRRRGLGLTQRSLGQQAGYASETIRKVEADELRPSRQMAERLADALQIEPAERDRFVRFARDEPEAAEHALTTQTVQLQPGASPAPRRHNLPAALTTFIGREKEIAAIRHLLATQRLVTLTGAGGMGKSRLAIEAAVGLLEAFADGVWLVELAPVADPLLVPSAVARVLGVTETAGQPMLAALADHLRAQSLLLVLDNCEHLIEACAQAALALLQAGPGLRLLATSREALDLPGEALYPLPPLSLPPAGSLALPDDCLSYEAVRLFSDRAVGALPSFAVTPANASAVMRVCQHLDGMPLALELAAARVKALRVEQIAVRLHDRFGLLAGGNRAGLPRHQTLRATIDWSYELLPETERAVLRRAAVFAGGWTLEAAETVCTEDDARRKDDGNGSASQPAEMLDTLTSLARKSMIVVDREPGREARYRLLETIREYALARLEEAGEQDAAQARHARFFVELAEEAEPHIYRADQAVWLERLRDELDNLRAALAWSLEQGHNPAYGERLGAALHRFWVLHGYLAEGVRWLELAYAAGGPPEAARTPEAARRRGRLCSFGAYVIMSSDQTARSAEWAAEGLALARAHGSPADVAQSTLQLAWSTWLMNDLERGRALFEEAIGLAQAAGHGWYEAVCHFQLGGIAIDQGRYADAEAHWLFCLARCRDLGEDLGVADTLGQLGWLALLRGHYDEARVKFQAQLAQYRVLGVLANLAGAIAANAFLAFTEGDYAEARRLYEESLAAYRQQGEMYGVRYVQWDLAHLAWREGNYEQAEALLRHSLALWDDKEAGHPLRVAVTQRTLGQVAHARGDAAQARALYRESLVGLCAVAWDRNDIAETLRCLALLLAEGDQKTQAVRLLAAAAAHRAAVGYVLIPIDQAETDEAVAALEAAMGQAAFAAAWAEGAALTVEQAAASVLEERN